MTTPSDGEPGPDQPPAWDYPPQPPAWDRPAGSEPVAGADPYAPGSGAQSGGPPPGPPGQGWGPAPYGGPAGYGPPPGYGGPQQTDTKAVVGLVFAIGSFVVCPVIPAVIALFLANSSQRDIDASGGRLGGSGLNKASRVVSWINLGLALLGALAVAALVAVGAS